MLYNDDNNGDDSDDTDDGDDTDNVYRGRSADGCNCHHIVVFSVLLIRCNSVDCIEYSALSFILRIICL